MINIDAIKPYIHEIDKFHINLINSDIDKFGKDIVFQNHLRYLDCTRISENGERIQQTIGFPYISEITQIIYIIETYFNEDAEDKLKQVLDQHNRNIEFEKDNPPIWYGGEKAKNKWEKKNKLPRRKNVDKSLNVKSNVERLNHLDATFGKLTFKIKPI